MLFLKILIYIKQRMTACGPFFKKNFVILHIVMTFELVFTLLVIVAMVVALAMGRMRPGMLLFSAVVLFLCGGILSPREMLEGFSNKGMITVALLFLVSEGVRQSGALATAIKKLLPQRKTSVRKAQLRMLPSVAVMSAFLNNTPVVVILAPIVKRWADRVGLPASKFLIPLSYVTILGGVCTLIGTSTNLVVHGMMLEEGYDGFTMFELGKVGVFVAIAGMAYILIASPHLLPSHESEPTEGDVVEEDSSPKGRRKRWWAIFLLLLLVVGATVGELPVVKEMVPHFRFDMFFFASVVVVVMAWTGVFSAREYTKYVSWDVLITIACAFAISKALINSGVADTVASFIISLSENYGPHMLLAILFIITNVFTEIITNNAAAALTFPLALSLSEQMGVNPMPFFVVICMAASASFSTPIGYQTNLVVQGLGGYRFADFTRMGLPLNIITFIVSVTLIPMIWHF